MATPVITDVRARPGDLVTRMVNLSEEARRRKMSLSEMLEQEDNTADYGESERANGLDAFGRVLRETGIKTATIPEMGIIADELTAFGKDDNTRVLFGEWLARCRRRAAMRGRAPQPQTRASFMSTDFAPGTAPNQIFFDPRVFAKQIAPAVPISEVVADTIMINGATYEAFHLTDSSTARQMVRIAEGTEVPETAITGGDHTIRVHKFGRKLVTTYEQMRRIRIDLVARIVALMSIQAEVDKLAEIIDVAVNGDGNSGTSATVYNLTTLDSSVSAPDITKLTLKAWLHFKAKLLNPYQLTTVLVQEDGAVALQTLSTGSANLPLAVFQAGNNLGSIVPINPELGDGVRLGQTAAAPTNKIVGFDDRFAIYRIVESGSDITESFRWITKQVEHLVMTVDEAYTTADANAVQILDCSA